MKTVNKAVNDWLVAVSGRAKSATVSNYRNWLQFFTDQHGGKLLADCDRAVVNLAVQSLRARVDAGEIGGESAYWYAYTLRRFFRWCYSEGIVEADPSVDVVAVKPPLKRVSKAMKVDSFKAIGDVALHRRDVAILQFLAASAARPSEVVSLRVDRIDFIERTAVVDGKVGPRTVQFDRQAGRALREWLLVRKSDSPFVFVSLVGPRAGQAMRVDGVRQLFRRLARRAGITDDPRISTKYVRHLVLLLTRKEHDLEVTRKRAGHKRLETTTIYAPADDSEIVAAMGSTGKILRGD